MSKKILVLETSVTLQKLFTTTLGDEHNVQFIGGCPGNTTGVSRLVEGAKASDIITRLKGIRCGAKPTSCPDQLAQALQKEIG